MLQVDKGVWTLMELSVDEASSSSPSEAPSDSLPSSRSVLLCASDSERSSETLSGKQIHHRLTFAVFGGVKRAAFHIERSLRADSHRLKDGGVQVGY